MGRTVRDTNLETRSARLRLASRGKPYWRVLESGLHLGYRRTKVGGGTWVARRFIGAGRYSEVKLGTSDDLQDADGVTVLGFKDAQHSAREWWKAAGRSQLGVSIELGPYLVSEALGDYFEARERRGSKGVPADRSAAEARVVPSLGSVELDKLTTKRIREWHTSLAAAPKLVRTKATAERRATKALDPDDQDAVRARRATANRVLTVLKAALNYAFHEGRISSDDAWRKVKPFREVDAPVVRFLTPAECQRLVNASDGPFRDLVRGALLTGCRYGELTRMRASDFNPAAGTVTVQLSKSGKPRHVVLNKEGREFFTALTVGRTSRDLVFQRADNSAWLASQQRRPLESACKRGSIEPAASFHVLRHSYASALAMKGVPMGVIAAQLGHSDTRMTERHYAHLAPSYIADSVRAALPALGILERPNVVPLARAPINT
jgi:integrase